MKSLEKIRKALVQYDKAREKVIQASRKTIQHSKQAIYAIQRDDLAQAEQSMEKMDGELSALQSLTKKTPKLSHEGISRVAIQEYVEAQALYHFVKKGTILSYEEKFGDHENYLLGLCDLSGELVRKAINACIKDEYKLAIKIRKVMEELYTELSKIDYKNGELRRKYDGIKYDLKKLDDVVFQLKLKDKI